MYVYIYAPSDHQAYLTTHLSISTKEQVLEVDATQLDHYTLLDIQDTQMAAAVVVGIDPHILAVAAAVVHIHDYS